MRYFSRKDVTGKETIAEVKTTAVWKIKYSWTGTSCLATHDPQGTFRRCSGRCRSSSVISPSSPSEVCRLFSDNARTFRHLRRTFPVNTAGGQREGDSPASTLSEGAAGRQPKPTVGSGKIFFPGSVTKDVGRQRLLWKPPFHPAHQPKRSQVTPYHYTTKIKSSGSSFAQQHQPGACSCVTERFKSLPQTQGSEKFGYEGRVPGAAWAATLLAPRRGFVSSAVELTKRTAPQPPAAEPHHVAAPATPATAKLTLLIHLQEKLPVFPETCFLVDGTKNRVGHPLLLS